MHLHLESLRLLHCSDRWHPVPLAPASQPRLPPARQPRWRAVGARAAPVFNIFGAKDDSNSEPTVAAQKNVPSKDDDDYEPTIVAGDSDDEASKVLHKDKDGDGDDSHSENETMCSEASSRLSSTRPQYARGPGRRKKKAERTQRRMAEKLGKDFVPQAQHEAQLAVMNELMAKTKQESDNMAERNFSVMRFMEVPPRLPGRQAPLHGVPQARHHRGDREPEVLPRLRRFRGERQ